MSSFKPMKGRERGSGRTSYNVVVTFPMWRNWIRRHRYTYKGVFDARGNLKQAVMGLLSKYKNNGKMLMNLQGQDF